jgi:hypothetical protein
VFKDRIMRLGICLRFLLLSFMLALVCTPQRLAAQVKEDLHPYFDDGGLSKRKNILATNFLSPISGIVGLRYERAIGNRFSVEVGAYKVFPYYVYELILPIDAYISYFEPRSGFGLSVAPHYFFSGKAPEYHYMGPRYGWRHYSLQSGASLAVHDLTWDYGYNLFLSKYLMFCYEFGMGYRRMLFDGTRANSSFIPLSQKRGTIYMYWSIGLGVMF